MFKPGLSGLFYFPDIYLFQQVKKLYTEFQAGRVKNRIMNCFSNKEQNLSSYSKNIQ